MSTRSLLEQLDRTTELLAQSLAQIVKFSSLSKDSDKIEESGQVAESVATMATDGIVLVNTHTSQLIKGIQDLLVMTRTIREKWLLSQVPDKKSSQDRQIDVEKCSKLLEEWVSVVVTGTSPQ
ncbi:LAMI_0B04874g1_1 [Lachancea mirantina]|uniref:Mediator of RNA polymerase II transcription subunit 22 n=1 Tax=Lachancea mirantina TaxID=1230905 RepID=A0A1G4IWC9_9SACH|nr:LAMI_0B04874g1_1 [Lachancea mirantina]